MVSLKKSTVRFLCEVSMSATVRNYKGSMGKREAPGVHRFCGALLWGSQATSNRKDFLKAYLAIAISFWFTRLLSSSKNPLKW